MNRYTETQRISDLATVENALQYLDQIRENFGDVVVFPEVVTIKDVCSIALDTAQGPQQVGDVCSRDEIIAILRAIEDSPCGDIPLIAQLALNNYRETQLTDKE